MKKKLTQMTRKELIKLIYDMESLYMFVIYEDLKVIKEKNKRLLNRSKII